MTNVEASEMTVSDRLVAHVRRVASLPAAALPWHAVSTALVDTLAVGCAGATSELATQVRQELGATVGSARVWGTSERLDTLRAALLNGVASHVLELDDIYAPGTVHPGTVVVPAALAVADELGSSGEELARAVIAGYEVCGRLAADLGPSHYRNWHTTGTAGAVGAAAAASLLRDDDDRTMRHAMALAATMAGGLVQLFRSDASGKPLHAGHAAMAGVLAAATARAGMGGAADVFEGPHGMAVAMGGSQDWTHVAEQDGHFCIEEMTVKPYPCCGHSFAAIDAALELTGRVPLDEVVSLTVDTYQAGQDVAGIQVPASAADCRFSIPFLVALALTDGEIVRTALSVERLADPTFAALVSMVQVRVDPAFEDVFPQRRGAEVHLLTRDGRAFTARVADRSGSPANPLSRTQIRAKFDGLLHDLPVIERDALHDQLVSLDQLDSVATLALPTGVREAVA